MSGPVNVRQIAQYPPLDVVGAGDVLLLQQGGLGGPYASVTAGVLGASGVALNGGIAVNGARLDSDGSRFVANVPVAAPSFTADVIGASSITAVEFIQDGSPVASLADIDAALSSSVTSFNGRQGDIILEACDVLRAGGVLQVDPHFAGRVTAPSVWDPRQNDDTVATTNWVHRAICDVVNKLLDIEVVTYFNGRFGAVTLLTADVNAAYAVPGDIPLAPTQAPLDSSDAIATTLYADDAVAVLQAWTEQQFVTQVTAQGFAPLASPNFTGIPTAPTASTGTATGQLATTAFVHNAVAAATTGVSSFNGRTGAVTLQIADITGAGGAPLASPSFTGSVTGPTPAVGTNNTQLATTAFVAAALATLTSVSSFNARTGAVTLQLADVTGVGGAPIASPTFTGTPAAPTAAPGTNSTQLATTAFVAAAVTAGTAGVSSFNGRTGAVSLISADVSAAGGALNDSPSLTGTPSAPTAAPGTNTTQLATTAFVAAAVGGGAVASFNGRTGAVSFLAADVTGVGGALLASPAFSGTPTAPTAAPGTNNTQLATTAFVTAAIAGNAVASFNGRVGAVTLTAADITGAGGAILASPAFTGAPTAPTPAPGNNSTTLATTAFVVAAIAAAGVPIPGRQFTLNAGVSTETITGAGAVLNLASGSSWNPTDLLTTTLSNGNLTATSNAATAGGVRGFGLPSSGKVYFEVTMATWTAANTGVGVGLAAANFGSGITFNANAAGVVNGGGIWIAGGAHGSVGAGASGTVICIALDLGAQLIWLRAGAGGSWNGTGANPAVGTGGLSISALSGQLFPFLQMDAVNESGTANFGGSAFAGAVPSGFSAPVIDYLKINNKNLGGVLTVQDGTLESGAPANYLVLSNNVTGQPSTISTAGSDANRSIQLVPAGSGSVQAPTRAPGDNTTAIATTAFVAAAALRSYLAGLALSTAGAVTTFSVAAGVAVDSTNVRMMTLASALTKSTAAWAVGNNNGALDTGTIAASTWYHVHLIMRTDTGVVDVLVSLSASAPTLPASYTLFRRIGSLRTNASSQWTLFIQNGNEFLWPVAVYDVQGVTPPTASRTAYPLTVPLGVIVNALYRITVSGAQCAILATSMDETDQAVSSSSGAGVTVRATAANDSMSAHVNTRTNTSAQIGIRSSVAGSVYVDTYGWIDSRGRDA